MTRSEIAQAVLDHANAHYCESGWDWVVECWTLEEIAAGVKDCLTADVAIARMANLAAAYDSRRLDAQNA